MNFSETVLSALVPRNLAELPLTNEAIKFVISKKLTAHHFEGTHKFLFETILLNFNRSTLLDSDVFNAYLAQSKLKEEEKTELRILFSTCRENSVPLDKLETILPAFIEQQNTATLGEILKNSAKVLAEGMISGKATLKGPTDAKRYLLDKLHNLQESGDDTYPSGNLQESVEGFWKKYQEYKINPHWGIKTFITEIDRVTKGGIRPGELFTLAGFAKHGKSAVLRNIAYSAMLQRKNVAFFSLEVNFEQTRRLFISLHSVNKKFFLIFCIIFMGFFLNRTFI